MGGRVSARAFARLSFCAQGDGSGAACGRERARAVAHLEQRGTQEERAEPTRRPVAQLRVRAA